MAVIKTWQDQLPLTDPAKYEEVDLCPEDEDLDDDDYDGWGPDTLNEIDDDDTDDVDDPDIDDDPAFRGSTRDDTKKR